MWNFSGIIISSFHGLSQELRKLLKEIDSSLALNGLHCRLTLLCEMQSKMGVLVSLIEGCNLIHQDSALKGLLRGFVHTYCFQQVPEVQHLQHRLKDTLFDPISHLSH
jgi:hypothetical protein